MANEKRIRTLGIGGQIEDANALSGGGVGLTAAATTFQSAGLAALPVIDTTNHLALILDPDGEAGSPEIVAVTAHTSAATTATILRGQEGSTARDHPQDIFWVHGPTPYDFNHMLAVLEYLPGTDQLVQITATSPTVVDATNLKVTFIAPPGGRVLHRHTIEAFHDSAGGWGGMALLDGTNTLVTGSKKRVFYGATSTPVAGNIMYQWLESGLTPGTSYERRLAGYVDTGRINFEYGPSAGGVTMTVAAVLGA